MIRRLFDRMRPHFEERGKLRAFFPLYEALDTFLYTPGKVTPTAPHIRDALDLKRLMTIVVVALIPCMFMAMWNTGYQTHLAMEEMGKTTVDGWRGAVMSQLGLSYSPHAFFSCLIHGALYFVPVYVVTLAAGGAWEVLFAIVRKHEVNEGFLVTSALFPLTLPPDIPWWQVAAGISFGVVIGKEVFGGTGYNFMNPALTGRAYLYFAHAKQISGDVWVALDGYSGATSLGLMASAEPGSGLDALNVTWMQSFLGTISGSMGETSTLACVFGAVVLIATGIGSWRIMSGVLLSGLGFSTLLWVIGSESNVMFGLPPWWHLVLGGYAFGLVFMATDPVSASMTKTGKWFYGALIGVVTILIRVINPGYAEGIMLAILLANVFAPLIDYVVIRAHVRRRQARYAA
ncbi:MAG: NADH:ubiquinone reductase (Na(+)-transporting) subunit B [Planctomycetota bacterium]